MFNSVDFDELKNLAYQANPIRKDEDKTNKQIEINNRFFELCIQFVPKLVDELDEAYQKIISKSELEERIEKAVRVLTNNEIYEDYANWFDLDRDDFEE